MSKKLLTTLLSDFPEYSELHIILSLAGKTWPRFGISAGDLSKLYHDDSYLFDLLRMATE